MASDPPFARLNFAPPSVEARPLAGGGMILRSRQKLGAYPRTLLDLLAHWAETTPEAVFLAERRPGGGWRELSYAEAAAAARSIGQALLDRGLSAERPVMILSDNGIDHALLTLGAMQVGVPACPVSPAYSLQSSDHAKLSYIAGLLRPGLVFADNAAKFAPALAAVQPHDAEIIESGASFDGLAATRATSAVDASFAKVGPGSIAKILFTSGSTGMPKGVINTHRMMGSNQQAIAQVWPFLFEKPPVILDWLPWNHTFGGNHNFNMVLRHGGTLYIDGGKPAPGLIDVTVANLRDVSPTLYFNVPRGFDMLLPHLERDDSLRDSFFRRLDLIFYAAAALPQNLWERLEAVAVKARGERVRMVSSWGATETSPMATSVHFEMERAGVIGVPAPGTEIKMVPSGDKLELRVRGPNVTPGYWKRDDLTRDCFDEDGFYRIGDAGRLADPADPSKGILFDGRIAEDFKLSSGTWVHSGALRLAAISACAPVVQDAVIAGHDRDEIGLLIFPNPAGCRSLCETAGEPGLADIVRRREVRDRVAAALKRMAGEDAGSSMRITRAIIMIEPPSIDANEITDKGYINQRAVLTRRADLVDRLYAHPTHPDVILPL